MGIDHDLSITALRLLAYFKLFIKNKGSYLALK
jgi:hypothetical protein